MNNDFKTLEPVNSTSHRSRQGDVVKNSPPGRGAT